MATAGTGSISATSSNLPAQQKTPNPKKSCAFGAPLKHRQHHRTCKKKAAVPVACTGQGEQRSTPAVAAPQEARTGATFSVEFRTRDGCRLGISRYPDFVYNAQGGRGIGAGAGSGADSGTILVEFDVSSLYIPAMSGATTRFLGLPLPPFLKIDILPEALRGNIDPASGQVDLKFRSRFCFSVGSVYQAPPLFVDTTLTSEESSGAIRRGTGERMDGEGRCKLVGVAVVDPIDDVFMNTFLSLPTECIAYLNATISITEPN
ncbi:uncharacterized protein LOC102711226 [Oryza brachyantha]|uniref:uncharacterized protein LOC102711226 n=1 Tax=Oryza brachyantha TaxID=4533 RepID=UPI001AD9567E|nr:uncharacterized protein LOC102711226 [Oryza brachyantha]